MKRYQDVREKKTTKWKEMILKKRIARFFRWSQRMTRNSTSLDSSMWSTRLVGFPRKLDVLLQWTLNLFKRDHIRSSPGPRDLNADTVAEFLSRRHQLEWTTSDLQRLPRRLRRSVLTRALTDLGARHRQHVCSSYVSVWRHTVSNATYLSFPSPCAWTRRPSLDVQLLESYKIHIVRLDAICVIVYVLQLDIERIEVLRTSLDW